MTGKRAGAKFLDDLPDYYHYIETPPLAKDLHIGGPAGATYMFGAPRVRKFYNIIETSQLPSTRVGGQIAIQPSVVRAFLWERQRRTFANDNVEALIRLRLLLLKYLELLRTNGQDTIERDYTQLSYVAIELAKVISFLADR